MDVYIQDIKNEGGCAKEYLATVTAARELLCKYSVSNDADNSPVSKVCFFVAPSGSLISTRLYSRYALFLTGAPQWRV